MSDIIISLLQWCVILLLILMSPSLSSLQQYSLIIFTKPEHLKVYDIKMHYAATVTLLRERPDENFCNTILKNDSSHFSQVFWMKETILYSISLNKMPVLLNPEQLLLLLCYISILNILNLQQAKVSCSHSSMIMNKYGTLENCIKSFVWGFVLLLLIHDMSFFDIPEDLMLPTFFNLVTITGRWFITGILFKSYCNGFSIKCRVVGAGSSP